MSKVIILLTITSLSSVVQLKPTCFQYQYKPYENRSKLLSYLEDGHKIGHLSLTGTHDSMVYETDKLKIKTQELNISSQLTSGVRVIDISLDIESNDTSNSSDNDEISFKIARTNRSLDYLFNKVNQFLMENPRELVLVYISDLENGFDDNYFVKLDLCETLNNYKTDNNWVGNWTFNDTLGMHRGKILFASDLYSFDKCARVFKNECQFLKKHPLEEQHESMVPRRAELQIDYLWFKFLIMTSMDNYKGHHCYINDFHQPSSIFPRGIAKYGGRILDCFEPINWRIGNFFPGTQPNAMNILLVDYVTQEVIDRNNFINEIHHCSLD